MNPKTVLNALFLQGLWFATVMGAARGWMTPAIICFGGFLLFQVMYGEQARHDLLIGLIAAAAGFFVDTLWVQLGWVAFSHALPFPDVAPWWIVMLWCGLALTINSSLSWLKSRLAAAALLCLISGSLSYYAASRIGAVEIIEPAWFFVCLGLSWAVLIPGLLWIARGLDKPLTLRQLL